MKGKNGGTNSLLVLNPGSRQMWTMRDWYGSIFMAYLALLGGERLFRALIDSIGSYVKCDEETNLKSRMDVARICLRFGGKEKLMSNLKVYVNGHPYHVTMVEEVVKVRKLEISIRLREDDGTDSEESMKVEESEMEGLGEVPEGMVEEKEMEACRELCEATIGGDGMDARKQVRDISLGGFDSQIKKVYKSKKKKGMVDLHNFVEVSPVER